MTTGPYYATAETNKTEVGYTMPEVELKHKGSGVIDVINDFMWTASPLIGTFSKVPKLLLTERKQTLNSLLASGMYYLNAAEQGAANTSAQVQQGIRDGVAAAAAPDPESNFPKTKAILTKITGILPNPSAKLNAAEQGWNTFMSQYTGSNSDKELLKGIPSYLGIYQTEVTGFNYALPYFNDSSGLNVKNSWQDTAQTNTPIGTNVVKGVGEVFDLVSSGLNINQPGTFIEKPKYFQYDNSGKTITINFPLFNTVSRGRGSNSTDKLPYQQNYEFLWILAYQNRPFRKSFSVVAPAKLYTLYIPGMEFFPYCFIEDLTIGFKGTRRNLPVTLPNGDNIDTSIPEAYEVSITIRSLLASVSNMMLQEKANQIRVSQL
jgi:hypothetical protein